MCFVLVYVTFSWPSYETVVFVTPPAFDIWTACVLCLCTELLGCDKVVWPYQGPLWNVREKPMNALPIEWVCSLFRNTSQSSFKLHNVTNIWFCLWFTDTKNRFIRLNVFFVFTCLFAACLSGQLTSVRPIKDTLFTFGAEVHALHIERSVPQGYFLQYDAKAVHIPLLSAFRRMAVVYE